MLNIGDWLMEIFGAGGGPVLVFCIFLIFLIDAAFFPTLPELFFIGAFFYDPSITFGAALLIAAIAAEVLGLVVLYTIVGRIRVPKRIASVANKYIDFLLLSDERLLLLNRIAPMIPFSGAFVRIAGWNIKKSIFYVFLGCILKYGAILLMSNFFYEFYSSNTAQTVTIIFVLAVIGVSFVLSVIMKKRKGLDQKS
ncbi:hypothetical protein Mpt1_c11460 [Candidatus Methanoplasma termitum]|uniref:SNARE associated Golgi protein n=1 Tax=Candidatus Methanoplasma termitum TaxID=1577791 RepID=A0A0A7LDD5_9ARCH|nr:hypothetical protein [Candidatus Methanoplasma termitum]AIZ57008.1 hypothetical protein Mpt1_c11460 [Candidatus Methanoplasma termitum]MCL2334131.1 hypothetical protein [Candidatus Methanoplasma sp.]